MDEAIRNDCMAYVGRQRETSDTLAPETAAKQASVLGVAVPQGVLPATWHWAYFNRGFPSDHQGDDGHERLGLFLPPAPFHRRMWAASDVTVQRPLRIAVPATRRSTITDVAFKSGRSGDLCFVTVEHAISQESEQALTELQTIVYRDRGLPETALRTADDPVPAGFFIHPDMELFFYSALTHNGHRIHWDRDFCREVEGYPGLIVHGPLMATKLCDAMAGGSSVRRFAFRALAPVFDTTPIRLVHGAGGTSGSGVIERSDGVTSMRATLELA